MVAGRIQFLGDGGPQFLTVEQRPPSVTCHVGLSNVASCFIKQERRESSRKAEVTVLWSLVMGMTSHQHFHHLLVTSTSYTQGEGISQEVGISGNHESHLRSCLPYRSRTEWICVETKDKETIKEAITQARREIIRLKKEGVTLGRMDIFKGILSCRFHST